jgi:predicted nuclease of predicted toxin-antitoxin system
VARTLLDEQLPVELKAALTEVGAASVHDLGWSGVKNGELLRRAAEAGFTVFLTMDRSLPFQQNLRQRPFGVLVLRAPTSRLADLLPLVPAVQAAIATLQPGEIREVGA